MDLPHRADNRPCPPNPGNSTSPSLGQRADYGYAVQLVLSTLPFDDRIAPEVPEVRATHAQNFFALECSGQRFACPALPNPMWFANPNHKADKQSGTFSGSGEDPQIAMKRIENQRALAAFVDLASRAEYALPIGSDTYTNPLKPDLWKKVRLGGRYLLGPSKTPIKVLMDLRGNSWGYSIEKCSIASDADYGAFEKQMRSWQGTLQEYYGYFVQ